MTDDEEYKSVWEELSPVDVNEHKEKKGDFDYLGWTFAWKYVKDRYPDAYYTQLPDSVYADGSMAVNMSVTICELTHVMWLAVTDFNNRAIQNPDSVAVANARMRCLVKAIGMHGLGFYLYAGESLPLDIRATDEQWEQLCAFMNDGDSVMLRAFGDTVGEDVINDLFNRAPRGKKTQFKNQYRTLINDAVQLIDAYAQSITPLLEASDIDGVQQLANELNDQERFYLHQALPATLQSLFITFTEGD